MAQIKIEITYDPSTETLAQAVSSLVPSTAGIDPDALGEAVTQEALARLSPEERQIVLLHAAAGLKHREIARLLELPLSTVLSKYHRGLKKLKALMKGESDR